MSKFSNTIEYKLRTNVDLSGINKLQASLSQVQSQLTKMKFNSGGMNAAFSGFEEASRTIKEVQSALNKSFNIKVGMTDVTKLTSSLQHANVDLKRLYENFATAGSVGKVAFNNLLGTIGKVNVAMRTTSSLGDKVFNTIGNTVRWGLVAGAFETVRNSVYRAVEYVKDLDKSLNDIRIVSGQSAEQMRIFAKEANEAARNLGKTTTEFTNASLIFVQQGYDTQKSKQLAELTLKTANVTGQDTAAVSEQLTALINGYKMQGQSIEYVERQVDKLAKVAAVGAADLEELATGFSKVAAVANTLGVSTDQLTAQLSTIISVTREAPETVGNALKTIYSRLGDLKLGDTLDDGTTLGQISKNMEKVGVEVLDATGNMRNMGTIIEDLMKKWQTLSTAQKQGAAESLAGRHQYTRFMALLDNYQMYSDQLGASLESAGTLEEQQQTYMEGLNGKMAQLQAAEEGIINRMFNSDDIKPVIDALTMVLDQVQKIIDTVGGAGTVWSSFAATGARVISKQLGRSFSNFMSNQDLKRIARQFNDADAKVLLQSMGLDPSVNNTLSEQLIKAAQINKQNAPLMSNEQAQARNELFQQQINKVNEIEQRAAAATDKIALLNGTLQQLTGLDNEIITVGKNGIVEIDSTFQNLMTSVSGTGDSFVELTKGLNFDGASRSLHKFLLELDDLSNKVINVGSIDEAEFTKRLNDIKGEEFYNFFTKQERQELESLGKSEEDVAQKTSKLNKIFAQLRERFATAGQSAETTSKEFFESAQALQAAGDAAKQAEQELKMTNTLDEQRFKLQSMATATMELVGSLGQYASSITAIHSLGKIWSDEDIDNGEKILRTVESLAFILPMLVSANSGIKTFFDSFKNNSAVAVVAEAAKKGTETNVAQMTTITSTSGKSKKNKGAHFSGMKAETNPKYIPRHGDVGTAEGAHFAKKATKNVNILTTATTKARSAIGGFTTMVSGMVGKISVANNALGALARGFSGIFTALGGVPGILLTIASIAIPAVIGAVSGANEEAEEKAREAEQKAKELREQLQAEASESAEKTSLIQEKRQPYLELYDEFKQTGVITTELRSAMVDYASALGFVIEQESIRAQNLEAINKKLEEETRIQQEETREKTIKAMQSQRFSVVSPDWDKIYGGFWAEDINYEDPVLSMAQEGAYVYKINDVLEEKQQEALDNLSDSGIIIISPDGERFIISESNHKLLQGDFLSSSANFVYGHDSNDNPLNPQEAYASFIGNPLPQSSPTTGSAVSDSMSTPSSESGNTSQSNQSDGTGSSSNHGEDSTVVNGVKTVVSDNTQVLTEIKGVISGNTDAINGIKEILQTNIDALSGVKTALGGEDGAGGLSGIISGINGIIEENTSAISAINDVISGTNSDSTVLSDVSGVIANNNSAILTIASVISDLGSILSTNSDTLKKYDDLENTIKTDYENLLQTLGLEKQNSEQIYNNLVSTVNQNGDKLANSLLVVVNGNTSAISAINNILENVNQVSQSTQQTLEKNNEVVKNIPPIIEANIEALKNNNKALEDSGHSDLQTNIDNINASKEAIQEASDAIGGVYNASEEQLKALRASTEYYNKIAENAQKSADAAINVSNNAIETSSGVMKGIGQIGQVLGTQGEKNLPRGMSQVPEHTPKDWDVPIKDIFNGIGTLVSESFNQIHEITIEDILNKYPTINKDDLEKFTKEYGIPMSKMYVILDDYANFLATDGDHLGETLGTEMLKHGTDVFTNALRALFSEEATKIYERKNRQLIGQGSASLHQTFDDADKPIPTTGSVRDDDENAINISELFSPLVTLAHAAEQIDFSDQAVVIGDNPDSSFFSMSADEHPGGSDNINDKDKKDNAERDLEEANRNLTSAEQDVRLAEKTLLIKEGEATRAARSLSSVNDELSAAQAGLEVAELNEADAFEKSVEIAKDLGQLKNKISSMEESVTVAKETLSEAENAEELLKSYRDEWKKEHGEDLPEDISEILSNLTSKYDMYSDVLSEEEWNKLLNWNKEDGFSEEIISIIQKLYKAGIDLVSQQWSTYGDDILKQNDNIDIELTEMDLDSLGGHIKIKISDELVDEFQENFNASIAEYNSGKESNKQIPISNVTYTNDEKGVLKIDFTGINKNRLEPFFTDLNEKGGLNSLVSNNKGSIDEAADAIFSAIKLVLDDRSAALRKVMELNKIAEVSETASRKSDATDTIEKYEDLNSQKDSLLETKNLYANEYKEARKQTAEWKERVDSKRQELKTAEENYDTAHEAYHAAQDTYDAAQDAYSAAQGMYDEAQETYNETKGAATLLLKSLSDQKTNAPVKKNAQTSTVPQYAMAKPVIGFFNNDLGTRKANANLSGSVGGASSGPVRESNTDRNNVTSKSPGDNNQYKSPQVQLKNNSLELEQKGREIVKGLDDEWRKIYQKLGREMYFSGHRNFNELYKAIGNYDSFEDFYKNADVIDGFNLEEYREQDSGKMEIDRALLTTQLLPANGVNLDDLHSILQDIEKFFSSHPDNIISDLSEKTIFKLLTDYFGDQVTSEVIREKSDTNSRELTDTEQRAKDTFYKLIDAEPAAAENGSVDIVNLNKLLEIYNLAREFEGLQRMLEAEGSDFWLADIPINSIKDSIGGISGAELRTEKNRVTAQIASILPSAQYVNSAEDYFKQYNSDKIFDFNGNDGLNDTEKGYQNFFNKFIDLDTKISLFANHLLNSGVPGIIDDVSATAAVLRNADDSIFSGIDKVREEMKTYAEGFGYDLTKDSDYTEFIMAGLNHGSDIYGQVLEMFSGIYADPLDMQAILNDPQVISAIKIGDEKSATAYADIAVNRARHIRDIDNAIQKAVETRMKADKTGKADEKEIKEAVEKEFDTLENTKWLSEDSKSLIRQALAKDPSLKIDDILMAAYNGMLDAYLHGTKEFRENLLHYVETGEYVSTDVNPYELQKEKLSSSKSREDMYSSISEKYNSEQTVEQGGFTYEEVADLTTQYGEDVLDLFIKIGDVFQLRADASDKILSSQEEEIKNLDVMLGYQQDMTDLTLMYRDFYLSGGLGQGTEIEGLQKTLFELADLSDTMSGMSADQIIQEKMEFGTEGQQVQMTALDYTIKLMADSFEAVSQAAANANQSVSDFIETNQGAAGALKLVSTQGQKTINILEKGFKSGQISISEYSAGVKGVYDQIKRISGTKIETWLGKDFEKELDAAVDSIGKLQENWEGLVEIFGTSDWEVETPFDEWSDSARQTFGVVRQELIDYAESSEQAAARVAASFKAHGVEVQDDAASVRALIEAEDETLVSTFGSMESAASIFGQTLSDEAQGRVGVATAAIKSMISSIITLVSSVHAEISGHAEPDGTTATIDVVGTGDMQGKFQGALQFAGINYVIDGSGSSNGDTGGTDFTANAIRGIRQKGWQLDTDEYNVSGGQNIQFIDSEGGTHTFKAGLEGFNYDRLVSVTAADALTNSVQQLAEAAFTRSSPGDYIPSGVGAGSIPPSHSGDGSGGGGGGGGGGDSYDPKKLDYIEEEKDLYERVNTILDDISKDLELIANEQDRIVGDKLAGNINKQLKLTQKQIDVEKEKLAIMEQEAETVRGRLAEEASAVSKYNAEHDMTVGINALDVAPQYDEEGFLANYAEMFDAHLRRINGLIDFYNQETTEEGQQQIQLMIDLAKEQFENFKSDVSRYDALMGTEMNEIRNQIEQYYDAMEDLHIEALHTSIEAVENIQKVKEAMIDFNAVFTGIDSDDPFRNASVGLQKLGLYFDRTGKSAEKFYDDLIKSARAAAEAATDEDERAAANARAETYEQARQMVALRAANGELFGKTGTGKLDYSLARAQLMSRLINEYETTGESEIYRENSAQLYEDAQEAFDELTQDWQDFESGVEDMSDSIIEMIETIGETGKQYTAYLDELNDALDQAATIIELIRGDDYSSQIKIAQDKITNDRLAMQANDYTLAKLNELIENEKQFIEVVETSFDENGNTVTRQVEVVNPRWQAIHEQQVELQQDSSKRLQQIVENTQAIRDAQANLKLDRFMTEIGLKAIGANGNVYTVKDKNGNSLGDLEWANEQWELINRNEDQYLDDVNRAVETQKLQNKYQAMLNDSTDPGIQRQITEQMKQQLAYLREKNQLSKYDVEYANMQLDILQKRIALEEAQRNKSTLKLRRDGQGNYSYVYTADQNAIDNAENDLLDAELNAYNLAKNNSIETQGNALSALQQFREQMVSIITNNTLTAEEQTKRIQFLAQNFKDFMAGNFEQLNTSTQQAFTEAMELAQNLMDENQSNILTMIEENTNATSEQLSMIDDRFNSSVTSWMTTEETFKSSVDSLVNGLTETAQEYENVINGVGENTTHIFNSITDSIKDTEKSTASLIDTQKQFFKLLDEQGGITDGYIKSLNEIQKQAFENSRVVNSLKETISDLEEQLNQKNLEEANIPITLGELQNPSSGAGKGTGDGSGNGEGGNGSGQGGSDTDQVNIEYSNGTIYPNDVLIEGLAGNIWYIGSWDNDPNRRQWLSERFGDEIASAVQSYINHVRAGQWEYSHDLDSMDYYRQFNIDAFDTGGYTGDWDNSGRIAMLHQKELVLNKHDTENMLEAVKTLRDMQIASAMDNSAANFFKTGIHNIQSILSGEQQVHIEASFPGVQTAIEIQNALLGLANQASHHMWEDDKRRGA